MGDVRRSRGAMRKFSRAIRVVSVVCGSLLGVPAGQLAFAQSPSEPSEIAPSLPGQIDAAAASDDYVIGPGDTIRVFVLRNPELGADVPVRPDGKVTTPLVQDMVAVGKTPSQLGRDIEIALAEYVRSPQVSVIVLQPASTFSQIRVVGQAVAPRAIPYRSGMTVLDVIIAVGGLSEFAAGNRARLVRTSKDGATQRIKVRLNDLISKGDMKQNLRMEPGDVLIIPESAF
ncbi:MAG: polysaccharide export protein [Pseudomonadales bacterium]|nr:polysaccharide export protein [Pseudomonadales bacterium]